MFSWNVNSKGKVKGGDLSDLTSSPIYEQSKWSGTRQATGQSPFPNRETGQVKINIGTNTDYIQHC